MLKYTLKLGQISQQEFSAEIPVEASKIPVARKFLFLNSCFRKFLFEIPVFTA